MLEMLKRFFEEKDLPTQVFEVKHSGTTHLIESDFVIETILKAPTQEQKKIAEIIFKIDFRNGNVMHFLEHLAKGYVKNNC